MLRPRGESRQAAWPWCSSSSAARPSMVDGKPVDARHQGREVISVATIRGVFGNRFQITGLTMNEARETGAADARRRAGGADLHRQRARHRSAARRRKTSSKGVQALVVGMAALFLFMILYYQLFGVVADLVLLANVVLLTALLSMLRRGAVAAGHRRHHPHRRHGGGRERADLRTHPRRTAQRRVAAGGDPAGFEKAFSAIARFQRHHGHRRRRAVGVRHRRRSAASPSC